VAAKLRVLSADDSAVYRKVVAATLAKIPDVELVAQACDGQEAVEKVRALDPDLVLLDIEMPRLDGLGALELLRKEKPQLAVVMVTSLGNAATTMKALSLGALEFIQKPTRDDGPAALERRLLRAVQSVLAARKTRQDSSQRRFTPSPAPLSLGPARARAVASTELVMVAISTGGPRALMTFLPGIPKNFSAPILIVQHMGAGFTTSLAASLAKVCPLPVREAVDGEPVLPGRVLIAPGGRHLEVGPPLGPGAPLRAVITDAPQENGCRPAADVLFRSAAAHVRGSMLALVMTGMGRDGCEGMRALREKGAYCLAQDEASCVVYGMPRAVVEAGLAHEVLPLDALAPRVSAITSGARVAA
jgi:two-component system chemotaxis response regulator CheB